VGRTLLSAAVEFDFEVDPVCDLNFDFDRDYELDLSRNSYLTQI
jgi:hypothetical protein